MSVNLLRVQAQKKKIACLCAAWSKQRIEKYNNFELYQAQHKHKTFISHDATGGGPSDSDGDNHADFKEANHHANIAAINVLRSVSPAREDSRGT